MVLSKDFQDIPTSGRCCRPDEDDVSACFAELWVDECDGCGILRTMSGLKSTLSTNEDGSTSMHVKKRGIIPVSMQKVCVAS